MVCILVELSEGVTGSLVLNAIIRLNLFIAMPASTPEVERLSSYNLLQPGFKSVNIVKPLCNIMLISIAYSDQTS